MIYVETIPFWIEMGILHVGMLYIGINFKWKMNDTNDLVRTATIFYSIPAQPLPATKVDMRCNWHVGTYGYIVLSFN